MRRTDQRRAAVVALYQHDVTGRPLSELVDPRAPAFTRDLVAGTEGRRDELDGLIERHAIGWTLDRIAPLERSILRVALFELLDRTDVPNEVAIDEAVEAAKELCSAEAPGFINGILGAVQREGAAGGAGERLARLHGLGGSAVSEVEAAIEELRSNAERLRAGDLAPEDAAALVERCAELAARVGGELDRMGREARFEAPPGQEPLL